MLETILFVIANKSDLIFTLSEVDKMFRKICTRCLNTSYSSTKTSNWQCPYCGVDLTEVRVYQVDHTVNFSITKKRLDQNRGIKVYRQQVK